jgi:uncharacterized HhH-GPD family protein
MPVKLQLAQDPAADKLLSTDPLALLIGMVLDQQIPLEWAFKGPATLKDRIGTLDAAAIADMDPDKLAAAFSQPPAIHRFPAANARRVQELCRIVVEEYKGKADRIWKTAKSGDELYRRIKALPGFGEQKARIFIALLGKQLRIATPGWDEAAGDFGKPGTFMSVADITNAETLGRVRQYKQEKKAAAKAQAANA